MLNRNRRSKISLDMDDLIRKAPFPTHDSLADVPDSHAALTIVLRE
jgi:hypothetical protein